MVFDDGSWIVQLQEERACNYGDRTHCHCHCCIHGIHLELINGIKYSKGNWNEDQVVDEGPSEVDFDSLERFLSN